MMDAAAKREREDFRLQVIGQYKQAEVIANRVGLLFSGKKKRNESDLVQLWDLFPELFEEEKKEAEKAQEEAGAALQKLQLEQYAKAWNRRRKEQ